MTPVWVVLGWPLFFVLRKPVYLWYEVRRGGAMLRAAVLLSRKVLSATKSGLPFHSRKNVVMGHGIDTEIFSPMAGQRDVYLLCAVGRITRIKRVDLFLRCLASLPVPYRLFIAGGTITDDDRTYLRELQVLIEREHLQDRVEIHFVLHEELPALLRSTQLFLHAGGGGLDKALLEAMACGCLVVAASEAAVALLPEPCRATPETFVARTREMLQLSPEAQRVLREQLRGNVVASHSLSSLICRMVGEIES
jgi:glycosyltransferase involved in cell wall biosynthesis